MRSSQDEAIYLNTKKINSSTGNTKAGMSKETVAMALVLALGCFYILLILTPVLSIYKTSGIRKGLEVLTNPANLTAIWLSLSTTLITTLLVFLLGTPVVFLLAGKKNGICMNVLEIMVNLPMALPPAVAGIGLLLAFGRNGFLGRLLGSVGVEMGFSSAAVILAQFFVSSGLYIQVMKVAVLAIDKEIFEAAYVTGAGKAETFAWLILPMLKKPMAAGLILAWIRALGRIRSYNNLCGQCFG